MAFLLKRWCRCLALLILASVICACTFSRVNLQVSDIKYPPKNPSAVQVFYEPPKVPYKEIGVVSAETMWTIGAAIEAMREKAAEVGADAIIIRQTSAASGYMVVTGSAIVFEKE